tara:strand:+ start:731 stop:1087 length:357 start_codon:yes stop_codon:yes gene_type:complete
MSSGNKRKFSEISNNNIPKMISSYNNLKIKRDMSVSKQNIIKYRNEIKSFLNYKNEIEKLKLRIKKEEQKQKILIAIDLSKTYNREIKKINDLSYISSLSSSISSSSSSSSTTLSSKT